MGTDFPYRDWFPEGKTVIQIDARAEHIGRRTHVALGLVGHAAPTVQALLDRVAAKESSAHLDSSRNAYDTWRRRQDSLTDPAFDGSLIGRIREKFDNLRADPARGARTGRRPACGR